MNDCYEQRSKTLSDTDFNGTEKGVLILIAAIKEANKLILSHHYDLFNSLSAFLSETSFSVYLRAELRFRLQIRLPNIQFSLPRESFVRRLTHHYRYYSLRPENGKLQSFKEQKYFLPNLINTEKLSIFPT